MEALRCDHTQKAFLPNLLLAVLSIKISEVYLTYDNSLPSILSDDVCYYIAKMQ